MTNDSGLTEKQLVKLQEEVAIIRERECKEASDGERQASEKTE